MKALLVVLDGAAGKKGKSAFEKAFKPNLDNLACFSKLGLVEVLPGVAPESDEAVLALLGVKLRRHPGRGLFEALGFGVDFKDGMLALRANFATASNGRLVDRRVGRSLSSKEAKKLEKEINSKVRLSGASFAFKSTLQHRGVLVLKSKKKLSAKITNVDPAYKIGENGYSVALKKYPMKVLKAKPLEKNAEFSAELVNEFVEKSRKVLEASEVNRKRLKKGLLPANVILLRGASDKVPRVKKLPEKYGKRFCVIADYPLEAGIGRFLGMRVIRLEYPKKFKPSDYKLRAFKAVNALKRNDFVYVHLKGPDVFGHDKDCDGKAKCIEVIDKYFFKPLLDNVNLEKTVIVVTSDHATPCVVGAHTADPVPMLFYSPKFSEYAEKRFTEAQCFKTRFKLKGSDLVSFIMEQLN